MHTNLEIKTRLTDLAGAETALRRLGAHDAGVLVQRDTYFGVPEGRLKLREMPDRAELIEYRRDERGATMTSRYTVTPVADPAAESARLAATGGRPVVIARERSGGGFKLPGL